jgi:hypothetical protein
MKTTTESTVTNPPTHKTYHIQVDVDGKNVPVTFDHSPVTGRDIREQAGAPLADDLARIEHGKVVPQNIGLNDSVDLKEGEHFQALPSGKAS